MAKSPDAFRTIGEVSDWLETPTHVIRFWESRFPEIDPVQKQGGRRYFRPQDLLIMGGLKKLLHDDGLTIKAVQTMIKDQGLDRITALAPALPDSAPEDTQFNSSNEVSGSKEQEQRAQTPPEQKPFLLTPPDEILEPSHKWHLKVPQSANKETLAAALAKLSELRKRLADQIVD